MCSRQTAEGRLARAGSVLSPSRRPAPGGLRLGVRHARGWVMLAVRAMPGGLGAAAGWVLRLVVPFLGEGPSVGRRGLVAMVAVVWGALWLRGELAILLLCLLGAKGSPAPG